MKIVTFSVADRDQIVPGRYRIGSLVDGLIVDITSIFSDKNLTAERVLDCFDLLIERFAAVENFVQNSERLEPSSIKLCAPVPRPGKVICIGLNYRDHAEESGMPIPLSPVIFSKFGTCVIGHRQPIKLPQGSSQVDYEAELAFIIGRRTKKVKASEAMDHVFGYTNFNDVSARDFQFADGQWQRGKSCDTFAPMGPFIRTANEVPDPHNLRISFRLNGKTLQDSDTGQLIFKIPELVEFLSQSITLEPGDVIATGTPPGVGFARKPPVFMQVGDVAEVEIAGLGTLSNPIEN